MDQPLPDTELREQTRRLLQGRFKRVGAAALAAALVPLASVAISPAMAQGGYSGGPPPTCAELGGVEITISFNALDGHNVVEILPEDRAGGPDPKWTICHFGQEHTGPDFKVDGPFEH